ncbi:transglutaminase domain-containing protein [Engelhardtia mirabilis]|uniref:Transglutaminase-like superfamily protein n=1 Tax=Engelhardtia mirabilis TaxID=2528011 RepID=A0A518BM25_9BACT|nr:hypothetical protein Pla133_31040 [Planctomycetes bacterium Pla133]QDV02339.1 hypothetical protein Pla86_31030 [Planctomycetes bacterium Pla86]
MICASALLALALPPVNGAPGEWPDQVRAALELAGDNRPEIERVLTHFADGEDLQQLEAAYFLIGNMPGHGFVDYALFDSDGNEVPYSALDYPNFDRAQAALDELEAQHGPLEFEKRALVEDLQVLTTDLLVANIDQAFETWRGNPWARDLTFETFCEAILPHRGSNEPVEDWRAPLREEVALLRAELGEDAAAGDVAARMGQLAAARVGFTTLYYLHPTDQGFAEMTREGRGRCEDITNMTTYAMRAAGVASAADYTPWWGHRDNNHAWPVILDAQGRGHAPDGNRAAKVYRKTYAKQLGNLAFQLTEGETAPPWLDRETYRDVTDQYFDTVDVSVRTDGEQRFSYLCVFNGGEWRAIHWSRNESGDALFDRMHGGLLYLPAHWSAGELVPAAPPFFLTEAGEVQPLEASEHFTCSATLPTAAGQRYELWAWKDGWSSLGTLEGREGGVLRDDLPAGGLYWLVAEGSRRLERPFRVIDGAVVSL